jgi:hypothetical protein
VHEPDPDHPAVLDHLVYATPDVAATTDLLAQALGVQASPGGRHVGVGTHNTLVSFGPAFGTGSYLEVIGPDPTQAAPGGPRPFGIDELTSPALVAWAVRVSGIDAAVVAARARGWDPGDVVDLSRATPAGDVLTWRLTFARPELGGVVPFLIDWGDTAHPSTTAASGVTLMGFELRHPQVAEVQAALAAIGASATVAPSPQPGLRAVLEGPAGRIDL